MTRSGSKRLLTTPRSIRPDHRGTIHTRFLSQTHIYILYNIYGDEAKLGLRKWNPRPQKRVGCGRRFHDELLFAEALRKQNQLTNHPRKLKLWSRKQCGRPRGRHVGLEENDIGVLATAQLSNSIEVCVQQLKFLKCANEWRVQGLFLKLAHPEHAALAHHSLM